MTSTPPTTPVASPASPSQRPFRWTQQRTRAAHLLAAHNQSHEKIAAEVGCHRASLWRWMQHREFVQKVQEMQREYERVFFDAVRQSIIDNYNRNAANAQALREAKHERRVTAYRARL